MQINTEIKSVCTKFFEELKKIDNEQNEIYQTVLYFIHSALHLSMLYLSWTDLQKHEKFALNIQMNRSLPDSRRFIYPPIIRSFEYWDMLQDIYGAPGFSSNPLKSELSKETNRAVVQLLLVMEKVIAQINLKRKLVGEISEHADPRNILFGYKWRIIWKNINRKRNNLVQRKSKLIKNEEKSNEENPSDLSGCGDTTWYTEVE